MSSKEAKIYVFFAIAVLALIFSNCLFAVTGGISDWTVNTQSETNPFMESNQNNTSDLLSIEKNSDNSNYDSNQVNSSESHYSDSNQNSESNSESNQFLPVDSSSNNGENSYSNDGNNLNNYSSSDENSGNNNSDFLNSISELGNDVSLGDTFNSLTNDFSKVGNKIFEYL